MIDSPRFDALLHLEQYSGIYSNDFLDFEILTIGHNAGSIFRWTWKNNKTDVALLGAQTRSRIVLAKICTSDPAFGSGSLRLYDLMDFTLHETGMEFKVKDQTETFEEMRFSFATPSQLIYKYVVSPTIQATQILEKAS